MKSIYPTFDNDEESVTFGCLRFFISQRFTYAKGKAGLNFVELFCKYHMLDFPHLKSMLEYYGATKDTEVLNIKHDDIGNDTELKSELETIYAVGTGASSFVNGVLVTVPRDPKEVAEEKQQAIETYNKEKESKANRYKK
jgi:hypothetical protein